MRQRNYFSRFEQNQNQSEIEKLIEHDKAFHARADVIRIREMIFKAECAGDTQMAELLIHEMQELRKEFDAETATKEVKS